MSEYTLFDIPTGDEFRDADRWVATGDSKLLVDRTSEFHTLPHQSRLEIVSKDIGNAISQLESPVVHRHTVGDNRVEATFGDY